MKASDVKVGMVVVHKTEGLGRITQHKRGNEYCWMSSMATNCDGLRVSAKNLRTLTKREKGTL